MGKWLSIGLVLSWETIHCITDKLNDRHLKVLLTRHKRPTGFWDTPEAASSHKNPHPSPSSCFCNVRLGALEASGM